MSNYKHLIKQIARTRISFLLQRAHDIFLENKELSNRYVYLARRYAQRARIQIPIEWKKRICHKCKKFFHSSYLKNLCSDKF